MFWGKKQLDFTHFLRFWTPAVLRFLSNSGYNILNAFCQHIKGYRFGDSCSVTIDVILEQWKKRLSSDIMRNDNKTQRKDSITTWKIMVQLVQIKQRNR